MKRIMSMPKLLLKISLVLTLLIEPLGNVVGQSLQLSNCFQKVQVSDGKNVRFLHTEGNPIIFYNSSQFPYFLIRQYDPIANQFTLVNFDLPLVDIPDASGNFITVYQNFPYKGLELDPDQPVIMDFYSSGPSYTPISVTIDFIGPEEAFNFKPYNQSCFTYDNVRFKSDFLNLEGLCNNQIYTLTLPPDAPNRKGLGVYSERVWFEDNEPASNPISIPIDQNECATTRPDGSAYAGSYPYGCLNFNMDITLLTCYPNSEFCPDGQITISVPITVCCACDAPTPNSRNTDNAALSGQNSDLSIFPNPNNTGKLEINAANSPIRNIKIYAVDGRLVKEVRVPEQNKISVDISGLKPGMYQVKVSDMSNAVVTQKLVVQ